MCVLYLYKFDQKGASSGGGSGGGGGGGGGTTRKALPLVMITGKGHGWGRWMGGMAALVGVGEVMSCLRAQPEWQCAGC